MAWGIVTESDVPRDFAANVQWVHSHKDLKTLAPMNEPTVRAVANYLAPKFTSPDRPLKDLTEGCDQVFALKIGTSLAIVRHLIANRRLDVDMNIPIRPEQPLRLSAIPAILK